MRPVPWRTSLGDMGEVRATAESGGQKGRKATEAGLIPPAVRSWLVSRVATTEHVRQAANWMLDFERGHEGVEGLTLGARTLLEEVEERWSTVDAMAFLADIYGFGAAKYTRDNYLQGYPYSWTIDAFWRHWLADVRGEELDPESGRPHLLHCVWHFLALREFVLRGVGEDDRLWRER